jgi:succinate-semialdehyde dehydrogenase/glutarate-semialdehyde dehydrogenase
MGVAETKEAIDAASAAFPSWSKTSPKVAECLQIIPGLMLLQERYDKLMKLFKLMQEHKDDLARIMARL